MLGRRPDRLGSGVTCAIRYVPYVFHVTGQSKTGRTNMFVCFHVPMNQMFPCSNITRRREGITHTHTHSNKTFLLFFLPLFFFPFFLLFLSLLSSFFRFLQRDDDQHASENARHSARKKYYEGVWTGIKGKTGHCGEGKELKRRRNEWILINRI